MSTILKETEISSAVPEALSARPAATATTAASNGAHSEPAVKPQPVALEVSVTVNGARTLAGGEKREPFSESTKTVLVFGNGAVIRLQSSVAPGQLLFLTNEKTKKEVVCQVVKSKNYRNVSGYVELEFTEPVIGFWGMRFPGDRIGSSTIHAATPGVATPSNGAPASGSTVAPVASTPALSDSTPAKILPGAATAISGESRATHLAETKAPAPSQPSIDKQDSAGRTNSVPVATSSPAAVAPAGSFVAKSPGSMNSSAPNSALPSSSVLTLPRAGQQKVSPTPINLVPPSTFQRPSPPASPAVREAPVPRDEKLPALNSAAETSTDELKAENARLQKQLSALLSRDANKASAQGSESANPATKISATPPPAEPKTVDFANFAGNPPAPVKASEFPPISAPVVPAVVAPTAAAPAPPAPVKLIEPAKISRLPLPSLAKEEHAKIPSWLEPLARNAAIAASSEDAVKETGMSGSTPAGNIVFDEPVPDAHWLHKDISHKDISHKDVLAVGGAHNGRIDADVLYKDGLQQDAPPTNGLDQDLSRELFANDRTPQDTAQEFSANVPAPTFGSRLLLDEKTSGEEGTTTSRKGLFAAIAAVILVAVLTGYWYTHQSDFSSVVSLFSTGAAHNTPAAQQPSDALTPATANPEAAFAPSNAATAPRPGGAIVNQAATPLPLNTNMVVPPARGAQPQPAPSASASPAANAAQPLAAQPAIPQPKRPALGEVRLAAPTVNRPENGAAANDADPSIGLNSSPAPAVDNLAAGFAATSGPAAPNNPVPIGGVVKSVQLLKTVAPIYPPFAKTQRISGDVKIDALIDATGKVTTMKVVSGPPLLHQAAMDALHQWKYKPATLDGNAVATHLTVIIQFRMQ